MPIKLDEAVAILTDSVLHVGSDTFDPDKLERAIQAVGNRFVRVTDWNTEIASVSLSENDQDFDPLTAINENFVPDQFIRAEIDYDPVELKDYDTIAAEYGEGVTPTKAQPRAMAFRSNAFVLLDRPADGSYTLDITRRLPFTTWTIPSSDQAAQDVTLPDEWVHDVIWFGGLYYLLRLAPGHGPGTVGVKEEWDALLAEAQTAFARTSPGVSDLQTHPGQSTPSRSIEALGASRSRR